MKNLNRETNLNFTMKTLLTIVGFIGFTHYTSAQTSSHPYFPLEIGNRWDYFVEYHRHGGSFWYDTLSVEIIDKILLGNGKEYFVYRDVYPLWIISKTKYVRMEDSCIYFYKTEDSTDCLAFRFDLLDNSTYYNCNGHEIYIWFDTTLLFNDTAVDTVQHHGFNIFSRLFGIVEYRNLYVESLVDAYYKLYGCKISGQVFGNLIADVDQQQTVIHKFTLKQNYPNPFNPNTTINYSISEQSFVTLKVYDILGRKVATLVNEVKQPGVYEVEWSAGSLASGIYIYRMTAGKFSTVRKMILIK